MPKRPGNLVPACLSLWIICLAGCSSTPPGPRAPIVAEDPIAVDGASVCSISVSEMVITIEPGQLLGSQYEGAGNAKVQNYMWGQNFAAETDVVKPDIMDVLGEAGYRTVQQPAAGTDPAGTGDCVLQLVGYFNRLEYNSYSSAGGFYQAYCKVGWELVRPADKAPLFKKTTDGYGRKDEQTMGVIRDAILVSLKNLLADEEFARAAAGN